MIGVDTNVLVRFFVEDDARQAALAKRFMNERTIDDPVFISLVVAAELIWALKQVYGFEKAQVLAAVTLLMGSANVMIEQEDLLKAAVEEARGSGADVTDGIIAALAIAAGAATVVTFDRDAARFVAGMTLLK